MKNNANQYLLLQFSLVSSQPIKITSVKFHSTISFYNGEGKQTRRKIEVMFCVCVSVCVSHKNLLERQKIDRLEPQNQMNEGEQKHPQY